MNPYIFTITFLFLITMLTSSELTRFQQSSLEKICYKASRATLAAAEEVQDLSRLVDFREDYVPPTSQDTEPEKSDEPIVKHPATPTSVRAKAVGVDAERPPNNARINFRILFLNEPSPDGPKEFSLYEVTARLMRLLYGKEPFFNSIGDAEYRLLDKLFEKKDDLYSFKSPDEFSELDLEDQALQNVLYHMLKGTKSAPSLLNYVTFDNIESPREQARKINLLFADPLVIHAIFPSGNTAEQLIEKRDQIWAAIAYQEENRDKIAQSCAKKRSEWRNDVKHALEEVLFDANLNAKQYKRHVFDCTLSKPGTIIFIENPNTHLVSREKYTPTPS